MSVYFVTCRELNRVKIGHACNPMRRFSALQTGSPLPLAIEATLRGGKHEERELHKRFAAYRISGEWFEITPEIEELISERRTAQNDKWLRRKQVAQPQQGDRWRCWTFDPEGAARINKLLEPSRASKPARATPRNEQEAA